MIAETSLRSALVVTLLTVPAVAQPSVGTAFTYQGLIERSGSALNDTADFEFTLWDDPNSGGQIGTLVALDGIDVIDGVFTVHVDFGAGAYGGEARWLQIAVRSPAGSGAFTTLEPRQELTPAPFSIATRGISVDVDGRVGIGTAAPAADFEVVGTSILGGSLQIGQNTLLYDSPNDAFGSSATFRLHPTADAEFYTGAVWDVSPPGPTVTSVGDRTLWLQHNGGAPRIIAEGAVGVGQTDPLRSLHVTDAALGTLSSSSLSFDDLVIEDSSPLAGPWIGLYGDDQAAIGAGLSLGQLGNSSDKWSLFRGTSLLGRDLYLTFGDDLVNPAANDTMLTLRADGDTLLTPTMGEVGIGESDPLAELHVQGSDIGINAGGVLGSEDVVIESPRAWLGLHSETRLTQDAQSGLILAKHDSADASLVNIWSMYRGIGTQPGDLHFTFGSSLDPANNPELMRLTSEGDLGIGETVPAGRLHVVDDADPDITFENSGSISTFRRVSVNFEHSGGTGAEIEARRESGDDDGMSLSFSTQDFGGTLDERMRITAPGDVGIGTTVPYARLHIQQTSVTSFDPNNLTEEDLVIEDRDEAWLGLYSSEGGSVGSGITLAQRYANAPADLLHNKWAIYRRTSDDGNSLLFKFTTADQHPTSGNAALELTENNTTRVRVLEIEGADVAERFPMSEAVEPGTVVEIDPENPGRLRIARGAYNRRVAGIVSGAGDLPVGAILGNLPEHDNAPPVALSGRVWVYCDATERPIAPGDLLTTAERPGHAMAVRDHARASGATLGKAMTSLADGQGLVLVLVSLQ